jgi:hypothetical protein
MYTLGWILSLTIIVVSSDHPIYYIWGCTWDNHIVSQCFCLCYLSDCEEAALEIIRCNDTDWLLFVPTMDNCTWFEDYTNSSDTTYSMFPVSNLTGPMYDTQINVYKYFSDAVNVGCALMLSYANAVGFGMFTFNHHMKSQAKVYKSV